MTSFESEATRIIDKFSGGKYNIRKFKMKMLLASIDIWDIVDKSEEILPSNADPEILKVYQRRIKKTISMIGLSLMDNQLAYIKSCKRLAESWKIICNIYETKSLFNIVLFICCKFFHAQDTRGRQLIGPHQQDQYTRRSTCLFGSTCEKQKTLL